MRHSAATEHQTGQRADRRALAEVADLIEDGVYDAASVLAWEIQRTSPGDPNIWLLLARIDLLRERHAAAIYAARMATRLDPSSADAWVVLAQTAVRRERWWTEGLDAALQATALAPDDAEPWTALARLQLAAGERYDAAVSAERAVRLNDDHRAAHVVLGQIALEAQEWQHAEAAYRRALDLDHEDADARVGLATALGAQDIDPAEELARYGSPVVLRGRGRGLLGRAGGLTRVASLPMVAGNRRTVIVVAGCLLAGLIVGAVVPGLGAGRGLVGAVALVLMWFAVRPLRRGRDATTEVAGSDATRDEIADAASALPADHDEPPAPALAAPAAEDAPPVRGDPAGPRTEAIPEGEWGPAEVAAAPEDGEPDDAPAGGEPDAEPVSVRADAPASSAGPAPDDDAGDDDVPVDGAEPVGENASPDAEPTEVAAPDEGTPPDDAPAAEDGRLGDGEPTGDAAPTGGAPVAPRAAELPHDPDALIQLSRERLAASDVEAAHAAASRLEAVAPGTVEAHRALGAVALAEHDYDQARQHYAKILEIEPLDQEAHERLAMIGEQRPRGRMRRLMGWR